MRIKYWLEDSIARRFALTIVLAVVVAVCLARLFIILVGLSGQVPFEREELIRRGDDVVRMLEAASADERTKLLAALPATDFSVAWHPAGSALAEAAQQVAGHPLPGFDVDGHPRQVARFHADSQTQAVQSLLRGSDARLIAVELRDASWVTFAGPELILDLPGRIALGLAILLVAIITVSAFATYQLSRPVRQFTAALGRFGADARALPIREVGPRELRSAIAASNTMQAQIQKFVDDRTVMLAAISHDLRTPLTKMRLRGEIVADDEQRARLFRDVDEMQAMVEAALSFFRDDVHDEETTAFDLPQLLLTIIDDYCDQGQEIGYQGPNRASFCGRPFALKRAFTNLIDNAIRYGGSCELGLVCAASGVSVHIRDTGPGIPADLAERVFAPFYRVERSRNRGTGGVGLGLTSARAVIVGHGGHIALRNRPTGGLEVEVTLPRGPGARALPQRASSITAS